MPPAASWSPPRAKVQLKLSIQRIRLLATKKSQLAKVTRREIAGFLEKGRIETARIKVEAVMGEDTMVDLLEVLELYCELLLARFGILEQIREIDPGVSEAVAGIIHASGRTELKELHILRDMLMSKYGREFSLECLENTGGIVSPRIISKLVIAQPPQDQVDAYLHEIAKAYGIDWKPEGYVEPEAPSASAVPTALSLPSESSDLIPNPLLSTPTKPHPAALSPLPDTPPVDPPAAARTVIIQTNLPSPGLKAPPPPSIVAAPAAAPVTEKKVSQAKADADAFDALSKRFAELKKR
ncbi:DUF292-domain-containing protein [Meredithblackwellia eburnea MCA 4105]